MPRPSTMSVPAGRTMEWKRRRRDPAGSRIAWAERRKGHVHRGSTRRLESLELPIESDAATDLIERVLRLVWPCMCGIGAITNVASAEPLQRRGRRHIVIAPIATTYRCPSPGRSARSMRSVAASLSMGSSNSRATVSTRGARNLPAACPSDLGPAGSPRNSFPFHRPARRTLYRGRARHRRLRGRIRSFASRATPWRTDRRFRCTCPYRARPARAPRAASASSVVPIPIKLKELVS